MSEHARLSPSGAKGWMSCPGKLKMEEPFPNTSSNASDSGTACHTVAAECLTSPELHPTDWLMDRVRVNNKDEPDRFVEFAEEMATAVTEYVDIVKALALHGELHVEQRVDFSEFVGVPGQFGTADAIILRDDGEMLVIDAKFGYQYVPVEDNPQLMLYALGALRMFELSNTITSVRMMIVQPRHGGAREWVVPLGDLMAFAAVAKEKARLVELASERHAPNMARGDIEIWERTYLNPNPNEEDCAFCRALATCPAARAKLEATVGAAFEMIDEEVQPADAVMSAIAEHPTDELGELMSVTGFLEDWIKAVRAEVERRLMLDEPVAGYGLELGRQGARAWSDEEAAEKMVREQFRIKAELAYKMKLHSPTQLEKLSYNAKPTKKNPNPAKAVITERQWLKLCALIKRADPVPSVKPLSQIKEQYRPTKPNADAFDVVPDEPDLY